MLTYDGKGFSIITDTSFIMCAAPAESIKAFLKTDSAIFAGGLQLLHIVLTACLPFYLLDCSFLGLVVRSLEVFQHDLASRVRIRALHAIFLELFQHLLPFFLFS